MSPVIRNHKRLYRENKDPWSVGNADAPRYNYYLSLLEPGESVLDMGCGTGAFTSRLPFKRKVGFDISAKAVLSAWQRYPDCSFFVGKITSPPTHETFDAIVCSDVIYYVYRQSKVIKWISEHLKCDGIVLIAAYAPGGKYPTPESLNKLVSKHLEVTFQNTLETGHTVILARKRRTFGAFTVDYENWMPTPGDPYKEVEEPGLAFSQLGIPITYFVNMAEPFNEKHLKSLGGDLQLHYHFGYPEPYHKAEDFEGSVTDTLYDAAARLEIISGKPVVAFRAGAYQVQPFKRLYWALRLNNIYVDSSVWKGGFSTERGYDFRDAPDGPYYADPKDAAKKTRVAGVIEIPIHTKNGKRWCESDLWQPPPGYNVLIAHTKGPHDWGKLRRDLSKVDVEWISMTEMVRRVKEDFAREDKDFYELLVALYSHYPTGLCADNCISFAKVARGMGFKVRFLTLVAEDMPNGRGPKKEDTHEVLSVDFRGFECIFDPTQRIYHPYSLSELLALKGKDWSEMYAGHDFFSRIKKYAYRDEYKGGPKWILPRFL